MTTIICRCFAVLSGSKMAAPVASQAMDAAAWQALGTWVTAGIAATAGLVARSQVSEARRLRLEQAQPQVVAFLDASPDPAWVDLVVKNFGATTAFDVRLACEPQLRRAAGASGSAEAVELPDLISTLVPGQEWRTWFDTGFSRVPATDLEQRYDATVTYRDARKRSYTAQSVLDFKQYLPVIYTQRRTLTDLVTSVEKIADTVQGFGEGRRGLSVYTRDGAARDRATQQRIAEIRRARAADGAQPAGGGNQPPTGVGDETA